VARASGAVGGAVFGPVLDGALLRSHPADVLAAGELRDVPLWLGWCRDEMATFVRDGAAGPAAVARARVGEAAFDRLLEVYAATAGPGEDPLRALLTDEMWVRPARTLAEAHTRAGGRVWLSRFDHAPSLPPFDALGPSHGADNACLWAMPPQFIGRPLIQRPGGTMTAADLAVTDALQASVLGMVRDRTPAVGALAGWRPHESPDRSTALFDAVSHVEDDPGRERRSAWDEQVARVPAGSTRAF
jgi:para-nitrobenzyl esterase